MENHVVPRVESAECSPINSGASQLFLIRDTHSLCFLCTKNIYSSGTQCLSKCTATGILVKI